MRKALSIIVFVIRRIYRLSAVDPRMGLCREERAWCKVRLGQDVQLKLKPHTFRMDDLAIILLSRVASATKRIIRIENDIPANISVDNSTKRHPRYLTSVTSIQLMLIHDYGSYSNRFTRLVTQRGKLTVTPTWKKRESGDAALFLRSFMHKYPSTNITFRTPYASTQLVSYIVHSRPPKIPYNYSNMAIHVSYSIKDFETSFRV